MTIKGIARSCLGDGFEDEEELRKLTESYHFCWRTMEVCVCECAHMCVCVCAHAHVWHVSVCMCVCVQVRTCVCVCTSYK